jgi:hypothetical protein
LGERKSFGGEGMSEINENNCVLYDIDLKLIQEYIGTALSAAKFINKLENRSLEMLKKTADDIFQKITKLNDLAKELREMEDEAPTAYRLLYKEKDK